MKELLKLDTAYESYAEVKKGPVFWLTVYTVRVCCCIYRKTTVAIISATEKSRDNQDTETGELFSHSH